MPCSARAFTFLSQAGIDKGVPQALGLAKTCLPVRNVRSGISKKSMIHNDATPQIEIDPETYAVTADGELLVCEPAKALPLAQRYFMF